MERTYKPRQARREKRIAAIKDFISKVFTIGTGVAVGVGMLWIIQVGVTLIFN